MASHSAKRAADCYPKIGIRCFRHGNCEGNGRRECLADSEMLERSRGPQLKR